MANKVRSFTITDDGSRLITVVSGDSNRHPDLDTQYMHYYQNDPAPQETEEKMREAGWFISHHENRDDALSDLFSTLLEEFDS